MQSLGVVPGVCARCEQGHCVERKIGFAIADDPTSLVVVDRACQTCGCVYERRAANEKEKREWIATC